MPKKQFYDLQEYTGYLEAIGDLVRVKAEVDPILEITEISSRVIKERGPALIFENVRGASHPLAINLFGTEERVELGERRTAGVVKTATPWSAKVPVRCAPRIAARIGPMHGVQPKAKASPMA